VDFRLRAVETVTGRPLPRGRAMTIEERCALKKRAQVATDDQARKKAASGESAARFQEAERNATWDF
jgi:hypothetical protein